MAKKLIVTAMVMGIVSTGAFSASAADIYSKGTDREPCGQYTMEVTKLAETLQAKNNELSEENSYGVSEAYTMKRPDVTKIEMLESEIKVLKNKINAAGIPECCRI